MTRCTWCRRTFTENEWVGHLTVRCWEHQKQPQWTTTPPTEPGIYWLRWRGNTACVEVVSVQRELVAFATRDEVGIPVLDTEYIGPAHWQRIEAPEVPR